MEITWKISQLERLTETGAVQRVHYYVCITSDGAVFEQTDTKKVDLTGDVTTAYADLTETQVIGWVKDAIGAEAVTALENKMSGLMPLTGVEDGIPW